MTFRGRKNWLGAALCGALMIGCFCAPFRAGAKGTAVTSSHFGAAQKHLRRARNLAALGNFRRAARHYKKALSNKNFPKEVRLEFVRCLRRQQRYVEALAALEAYLKTTAAPSPKLKKLHRRLASAALMEQATREQPAAATSGRAYEGIGVRRTNWSARRGPHRRPHPKWKLQIRSRVSATPLIDNNGAIFVTTLGGEVLSLTPAGRLRWKRTLPTPIRTAPAVGPPHRVFVTTAKARLFGLDARRGKVLWRRSLPSPAPSAPIVDRSGRVALVAERLFLFNHQGTPLAAWAPAQTRCHAGPTAAGKNSFFVGCDDGRVYRVKRTGPLHGSKKGRFKVTWSAQCATAPIRSTLAVGVAQTVFAVSADQHVCALSPRMNHKHALLWKVKLPHPITTAPSVGSRGRVVVATDGGTVVCLSAFGKKLWQHRTNGGESIVSRPLFDANGYVYFGGRDGYLRCLSPHGRLVWKRSGGADIDSGPALAPHRTLVVATDRFTLLGLTR